MAHPMWWRAAAAVRWFTTTTANGVLKKSAVDPGSVGDLRSPAGW